MNSAPLVAAATMIWAVIIGVGLAYEFYTVGYRRLGDTLSEHVWALQRSVLVWLVTPALTWVFLHWTLPWEIAGDTDTTNDLIYMLIGVVLAAWIAVYQVNKRREEQNHEGA